MDARGITAYAEAANGGVNKKAAGRTLEGRTWDEMPGDGLQVL